MNPTSGRPPAQYVSLRLQEARGRTCYIPRVVTAAPDSPILVYAAAAQLQWLRPALRRAGRSVAALAGPDISPRDAAAVQAEHADDLSLALRSARSGAVLLATRPPAAALEWLEVRGAAELRERGVNLVTIEPIPSSAMSPMLRENAAQNALPVVAPMLRHTPLGASLRDALHTFGAVQTALFAARGTSAFGGLGARLVDALDLLGDLLGEPESIDCAVASPRAASGVRAAPADDLTRLSGALTAHLRFESEASAVLSLSDHAGRWFRGLSLAGDSGLIRFDDQGFEWIDPSGNVVERTEAAEEDPTERLADRVVEALTHPEPVPPAPRVRTMAVAGAAILSARTGQPESPATIRRMANLDH